MFLLDSLGVIMKCRVCGNENNNKAYQVKEMMFGFEDEFNYFQCSDCGCLQITDYPPDMGRYYPNNYYSYMVKSSASLWSGGREWLFAKRDLFSLFKKGIVGRVGLIFPNLALQSLRTIDINQKMKILDVGCGSGSLLYSLSKMGFNNLLGVDPYIDADIEYKEGFKVRKCNINGVKGTWDVVMLHHSLEHMPEQIETVRTIADKLADKGVCIIRVPVVSSFAWDHYGVNWVQLDAPRHFYLHSVRSMEILAEKAGLELYDVKYDSTDFQFFGSEQYKAGIPLCAPHLRKWRVSRSILRGLRKIYFMIRAKKLNEQNRGDQAVFYFRHVC